ncbi:MAG: hypothetical protein JNL54_03430 [Kineosporiaceae bacterium]|nr:hypothetical protein [Kineosporiaceae bacterium]
MSDTTDFPVVPLVAAFGGLAAVAYLMDAQDPPPSASVTAPATATVTAPITNTITITNPAPAAPVAAGAGGVMGTSSLALVLGSILAVGLVAVLGGMAAAYLFGAQGGRRGLGRSGEYSYSPLAHEPRRRF